MNINQILNKLKKEPDFFDHVGMILIHNGVVRSWSRKDKSKVAAVEVTPDLDKIEELRRECQARPGIHRVVVEAASGRLVPGDDLLVIVVAGDLRENVKPALSELLDRVKAQAITKREIMEE